MARESVDSVQSRIASIVDQDESASNISSTDYSLRLKYINMALTEWAETWRWKTLFNEFNMLVSTSTGNASIVLPSDFRRLAGPPKITYDGETTHDFPERHPEQDYQLEGNDKRIWILGNQSNGYILRVFGPTLASGASVKVPYYASPQSLVSPANIAEIPNPDYLVQRTIAHLWESREDARFPQAKAEAERILRNMIEYEDSPNEAGDDMQVRTIEEDRFNFKVGRD